MPNLWPALGFRIELEFRNVGCLGEGKTRVPAEKPIGARGEPNQTQPTYDAGKHWWQASTLRHPCSPVCLELCIICNEL